MQRRILRIFSALTSSLMVLWAGALRFAVELLQCAVAGRELATPSPALLLCRGGAMTESQVCKALRSACQEYWGLSKGLSVPELRHFLSMLLRRARYGIKRESEPASPCRLCIQAML